MFTQFALGRLVFAQDVILEFFLLREELTTEVTRDVLLEFLMNLSLVTSQAALGLEV